MLGNADAIESDLPKIVGGMLVHLYLHVIFTLCWKVFEEDRKNCEKF